MKHHIAGVELRARLAEVAVFSLDCLPEWQTVRGNASAIDAATDKEIEEWILAQLESGNEWAWCSVRVRAIFGNRTGGDYLGCCSYKSEDDFKRGGYYEDMKARALDELLQQIGLDATLFNCCEGWRAPADWSLFDAVEVSPVAQLEDGSCEVIHDERTPDMWSVYAHYNAKDERNVNANTLGVTCITDCESELLAFAIGVVFEKLISEAGK